MRLPLVLTAIVSTFSLLPLASPSHEQPNHQGEQNKDDKLPQQKEDPKRAELAGIYECQGLTPDGKLYNGLVQIARNNGAYQLLWTLGPEEHHLGIGLRSGDVLAVSYFGGMPGVVAYRIEQGRDGPRLLGEWTVPDADGQVFREVLTRIGDATAMPLPQPRPQDIEPRAHPSIFSRLVRAI